LPVPGVPVIPNIMDGRRLSLAKKERD